ncbi:MAG: SUMF1/EgtB/PvdO family nonheme iron enzyme [Chloroflexi bacterium]|nr:SUMF1/EgtB/PvdO family nonheme iron enzyme [Chloroflexota bacterium]
MSDRRLALIIASHKYQDPDLRQLVAPTQDAKVLARVLQDPAIGGYEVQSLLNEPSHKVTQAIEAFFIERKRDDLLLLYFSGHGIKDEDGQLYFSTTNTRRKLLRSTGISANFVNNVMRNSRSRRQVLILDCCYSGAFARGMIARADKAIGTKERFEGRGRVVLTASDSMQYAFEGDQLEGEGIRSVFTHVLVQGLETGEADLNRDGLVSPDELYKYAYDRVTDEMPQQRPEMWAFGVGGDIIIARAPLPVVEPVSKPAELPSDLQQAIRSPLAGLREGAVRELEHHLHGSDKELTVVAQKTLTQLADDDSRRVSAAAAAALGITVEPAPTLTPPVEVKKPKPALTPQREPPAKHKPITITSPIHIELVRVPAGEFMMGSDPVKDKYAQDDEQPQHRVCVSEFYIAKTPLTNTQYAAFVKATKRKSPRHWEKGKIPSNKGNHPVVNVSWHDAIAFCKWLSRETSQSFHLPTEVEWEKAARGTDGRIYPWGDKPPTPELGNFGKNVGETTPVGQYSLQGDSPYGCVDMAGNVWEWTQSLFESYPYRADDGREDMASPDSRVLRGGSFNHNDDCVRSSTRDDPNPRYRSGNGGFRVVAAPFSPTSE